MSAPVSSKKLPNVWGIVPARGGSKGVPRKNIKLLGGHPLLYYTVKSAKESGVIDRLILSTEDEEIAAVGKSLGLEVPFLRPAELAQDTSPMIDVLLYTVNRLISESNSSPDLIFLMQPTSPFRTPQQIREVVQLLWESNADSLVTVSPVPLHLCPHFVLKIEEGKLNHFLEEGKSVTRRQDVKPAYVRNGTSYIMRLESLLRYKRIISENTIPYIMSEKDSLSIDTPEDWLHNLNELKSVLHKTVIQGLPKEILDVHFRICEKISKVPNDSLFESYAKVLQQ